MSDPKAAGPNAGYATALFYEYLENPDAVPEEWREILSARLAEALLEMVGRPLWPSLRPSASRSQSCRQPSSRKWRSSLSRSPSPSPSHEPQPPAAPVAAEPDDELLGGVAAAMALVRAYRTHGHLAARLDPLGSQPVGDPALEPLRLEPPLTPELQERIPANLLRLYVPGETLADVLPHSRRSTAARARTRSSISRTTRSVCGCAR